MSETQDWVQNNKLVSTLTEVQNFTEITEIPEIPFRIICETSFIDFINRAKLENK